MLQQITDKTTDSQQHYSTLHRTFAPWQTPASTRASTRASFARGPIVDGTGRPLSTSRGSLLVSQTDRPKKRQLQFLFKSQVLPQAPQEDHQKSLNKIAPRCVFRDLKIQIDVLLAFEATKTSRRCQIFRNTSCRVSQSACLNRSICAFLNRNFSKCQALKNSAYWLSIS